MKYTIGTRASRLSQAQTNWVVRTLCDATPDADFEIKTITTRGDTDARPLFAIDQRGIFEKEIDRQVSESAIDFAVHSMKDVPSELPANLVLACVPQRESADDVIITRDGSSLESLKQGARVGTSSLRRAVESSQLRADLNVVPVRGNIETRIAKVDSSELDAVILARAGLARLNLDVPFHALDGETFLPSPGQGALGLVARRDDDSTLSMLCAIEDADSRAEVDAERSLSASIESGCRFPVGARAECSGDSIRMRAVAYSVDGKQRIDAHATAARDSGIDVGQLAAKQLYDRGVRQLALNWRVQLAEWNAK